MEHECHAYMKVLAMELIQWFKETTYKSDQYLDRAMAGEWETMIKGICWNEGYRLFQMMI